MSLFSRVLDVATSITFYWFVGKTMVWALAISHGWHERPPDGLPPASGWEMCIDGALAVAFWWLCGRWEALRDEA